MSSAPRTAPQTHLCIALSLLAFWCASSRAANPESSPPPGLFREASYEDACQTASSQQKPVFILFDGDWGKDREKLSSKTLSAPEVKQLLGDKTIAIRLDVVEQPDIAKKHSVADVPMLLLLAPDGRELSRWYGAPKPKPFAEELAALLSGKSATQYKQEKISPSDLVGRNKLAAALIAEGQYEQARAELLWLYNTGIGPNTMVRKKLSTKQVIDNLTFLASLHAPSREIPGQLREQERQRAIKSPSSTTVARKLGTWMQVENDFTANLALFESLPPGKVREYIKVNIIVRAYARQRAFDKAANLLPVKQAIEEADKSEELSFLQRGTVRVLMFPFGGTHFSSQIINHAYERALNRRLFYYEIYAGAGRTDEARQVALSILDWDRLKKAAEGIRASTKKICGEKADAFLQSLALPQLTEPAK